MAHRKRLVVALLCGLAAIQSAAGAELQPHTLAAWETYIRLTEQRIAAEPDDGSRFLVMDFAKPSEAQSERDLLRDGEILIQKLETRAEGGRRIEVEDGMIHHWIGAIFLPGAHLDPLLEWLQDYDHHAGRFLEAEQSRLLSRDGSTFHIFLRLRRKKIITVYYNTEHTAEYRVYDDPRRASSHGFATRIAELDHPGTPQEREQPVGNDHGFLWRLNSYWRYLEADGGVYLECESVSLSRGIPFGLGWLIRGYVESVPRESLENTLTSIRNGVPETGAKKGPQ